MDLVLNMPEKVKDYICLLFAVFFLPLLMYFFIKVCGERSFDLIVRKDVIYFDWRSLPMLSVMPMCLYLELMLISCFFTKNKRVYSGLLRVMRSITIATSFLFVVSIFSGPVFNVVFYFSSYYSCPASSIFSGVYYVKDKSRCYGLLHGR